MQILKEKHVPWAQTTCLASFGPSLVFVWPALAVIGRRWPLVAFVCPVGAETGGLGVVGFEMHRWGVEMHGWEPKHVVEGWWVYYKEKQSKKHTPMAQTMPDALFVLVVVVATPQNLLVLLKT